MRANKVSRLLIAGLILVGFGASAAAVSANDRAIVAPWMTIGEDPLPCTTGRTGVRVPFPRPGPMRTIGRYGHHRGGCRGSAGPVPGKAHPARASVRQRLPSGLRSGSASHRSARFCSAALRAVPGESVGGERDAATAVAALQMTLPAPVDFRGAGVLRRYVFRHNGLTSHLFREIPWLQAKTATQRPIP
jgi:hypothetical protein